LYPILMIRSAIQEDAKSLLEIQQSVINEGNVLTAPIEFNKSEEHYTQMIHHISNSRTE